MLSLERFLAPVAIGTAFAIATATEGVTDVARKAQESHDNRQERMVPLI
jgi:hypothetical protein